MPRHSEGGDAGRQLGNLVPMGRAATAGSSCVAAGRGAMSRGRRTLDSGGLALRPACGMFGWGGRRVGFCAAPAFAVPG